MRIIRILMQDQKKLKLAVIAGAAKAMSYKTKNPLADESQVMNHVSKEIKEIIRKIEEED